MNFGSSDPASKVEGRSIGRSFDLIVIGTFILVGALVAALVPSFFITDAIGDWYEMRSPEIPTPGQVMPSYWDEHSGIEIVLGFVLTFFPAALLLFIGLRFYWRAVAPFFPRQVSESNRAPGN